MLKRFCILSLPLLLIGSAALGQPTLARKSNERESVSAAAEENAAFPVAAPESQGVSTASVRRVAGEVEEYVKNGTIVGGELLIIKNRKTILHEVYGERDREDKRAMERGTIFNIHSMTKPLTGVAVQMLADEGKLLRRSQA